jgi:hypothetical protein
MDNPESMATFGKPDKNKQIQHNAENYNDEQHRLLALEYEGVRKFTSFKIGKML